MSILTLAYVLPSAEARSFSSFRWDIDEAYHRDGHVQFVVQKDSENFLPIGIKGLDDVTVTLHPTINHDQTGKAKLPRGVDIYFEPDVVDLTDGEVKPVKLMINVDENAPANLYDVQIVGTWKEEGKIPDFMGSSIRLHVGRDFGDGKIPINMLEPPLQFWKLIKNEGGNVDEVPCRNDYVLVVKHDGSPACVKEQTVPKLIERSWIFDPVNNTIKQCAVEYDRIIRIPGCPSSGDGPVCEPKPLIAKFIEPSDEIATFKKMHCADNVDEWSHRTEHEEGPDNGQIDWKLVSGIHHENPTFDVYGLNEKFQPIKVGKEIRSTIQYWDIVSCFDAETRIVDKLTKEVIFENVYTYKCKDEEVGTFDKMMLRITDDVNWTIKLPGFYILEIESEKINLTEEFFVECTSGGCEFLTGEQLEGRQTYRFD